MSASYREQIKSAYEWDESRKEIRMYSPYLMDRGCCYLTFRAEDLIEMMGVLSVEEYMQLVPPTAELQLATQMRLCLDKRIEDQRGTLRGLQRAHDTWKKLAQDKADDSQALIAAQTKAELAQKAQEDEIQFRVTICAQMKDDIRTRDERIKSLEETNDRLSEAENDCATIG